MDITTLFKACVKTVRTRNKNLSGKDTKTDILRRINRDAYLSKAKEIMKNLTNLRDFLLENRKSYMNIINHFSNTKTMSDIDREQVDINAQNILHNCTQMLTEMKRLLPKAKSKQLSEHYGNVLQSLDNYLKYVGKLYAEQKAIRVKRALDNRKIGKLEVDISKPKRVVHEIKTDDPAEPTPKLNIIPDKSIPINPDDQLSAEEMQMFESENEQLFNELSSLSEEVQQIESKVVHIAELQQEFTEKVLEQEKDIERIASQVVGATENVKDANDQIRQAIQRNAGLRVWVLFFLLVMSFSLLFLDWYND